MDLICITNWLADYPQWIFQFTPTAASWFNAVEDFFSILTRKRLQHGVFTSVPQLEEDIRRFIREHNDKAKPFVWTKPAETILEKLRRLPASL